MISWFIVPYETRTTTLGDGTHVARFCAMERYQAVLRADGSPLGWSHTEVLGNHALVKVNALAITIDAIELAEPTFRRLPDIALASPMTALTNAQAAALRTRLIALGYSSAEVDAVFGTTNASFQQRTFLQLLRFIAGRRKELAMWNGAQWVFSGADFVCDSPEFIDARV